MAGDGFTRDQQALGGKGATLNDVEQFAHIPRPSVLAQSRDRVGREFHRGETVVGAGVAGMASLP